MIQRFFQTKSFVLLIYMGVAALAYYQVFFFRHTLQWDAIDCFLAWRHAVVELIRDGQLPLWNANAYLGFPLFADPECGAWYPVLWIFSAFGNYDFYSLAAEWCLHTIIAGVGMHVLVRQLGASRSAAFIAGISFMCSGMYVSNAQNFIYLIGISWFPWVMAAVRNMFERLSIKSALVASLPVYMMFSGSYPGITIIAFYALMVYIGYDVFYRRREWTDRLQRRRWLITVATFGFSSAILCALILVPVAYAMPWITRTQGLGAEKILENPLSLKAMVSFIFPFAVGDKQINWGSDFSMLNVYVGLFTLLLAGVGILFADRRYRWLIGSAVVLLMLAAGDMFPLRLWVAKLPGLGLFRHPSIFRFFLIFCLCLMAALSWEKLAGNRRVMIRSLLVVATGILAAIIFMWPGNVLSLMSSTWTQWNDVSLPVELPAPSRIFFQATIHLVLLTLAALFVWKSKTRWWPLLIAIDMVIAVQLNAPATIYAPLQTAEMNRQLEQAIASRSPYAGQPLIMMGGDSLRAGVDMIWRNEGIFLHLPQWDGYNSFVHLAYSQLEDSGELNVLIHRPLVFFENDSTSLVPQRFTGGRMEMNYSTGTSSSLVVMQNYMPGWKAELDGTPITIAPYRNAFLQMQIPPGAHTLTLHYSPNWIYWLAALWVGWVGMIIVYMMKGRGI